MDRYEFARRLRVHDFGFHHIDNYGQWQRAKQEHERLYAAARAGPPTYRVMFDAAWLLYWIGSADTGRDLVRSGLGACPFGTLKLAEVPSTESDEE